MRVLIFFVVVAVATAAVVPEFDKDILEVPKNVPEIVDLHLQVDPIKAPLLANLKTFTTEEDGAGVSGMLAIKDNAAGEVFLVPVSIVDAVRFKRSAPRGGHGGGSASASAQSQSSASGYGGGHGGGGHAGAQASSAAAAHGGGHGGHGGHGHGHHHG